MSDDTIKLANFGYLTKKLQENNIDTNEEELSSLFSQTLKNSTDGTVDINDFTQVLTNIYGIDDSSEILSTLSRMASVNNVENATVNNDLSTENSKEAIAELLEGQLAELESNFETAKSQNGGIGKLWDGIKNLTHIGAGSSKAQDELNNLKQQIEDYKNGKIDLATTYKNITGKDATQDDLNKLLNGEIKLSDVSTASEKIEGYAEGQKCVSIPLLIWLPALFPLVLLRLEAQSVFVLHHLQQVLLLVLLQQVLQWQQVQVLLLKQELKQQTVLLAAENTI